MAKPSIKVYFDVISPFAYFAFHVLRNSKTVKDVDIRYIPVLLGGIFNTVKNGGPLSVKSKSEWIVVERERWAKIFQIPLHPGTAPGFPFPTVLIQRVLATLEKEKSPKLPDVMAKLWEDYLVSHKRISQKDDVAAILENIFGAKEAEEILQKATSVGKQVLIDNTNEALSKGAFGVPFFEVTNSKGATEYFWGFDHLGQVLWHLGLERPQTETGWKAVM